MRYAEVHVYAAWDRAHYLESCFCFVAFFLKLNAANDNRAVFPDILLKCRIKYLFSSLDDTVPDSHSLSQAWLSVFIQHFQHMASTLSWFELPFIFISEKGWWRTFKVFPTYRKYYNFKIISQLKQWQITIGWHLRHNLLVRFFCWLLVKTVWLIQMQFSETERNMSIWIFK